MAIYDGIDDVQLGQEKYPFLNERLGDYVLEVNEIRNFKKFKDKKEAFKLVSTVVESSGEGAFPVGTKTTVMVSEAPFNGHLKDIKRIVSALINESPDAVKGAMVDNLVSDEQPATGTKFRASVSNADKKDGGTYKAIRYSPYVNTAALQAANDSSKKSSRKTA